MSEKSQVLFRQHGEVESAPPEGEGILYLPETNKFIHQTRTGSVIWEQVKEPASAQAAR